MKKILIIGIILGLTNCTVSQDRLAENKTFKKTFSSTEIQDLQLLFDFFNKSICSGVETQDLTDCYKEFFKRMEKSSEANDMQLSIPFDKQMEVYNELSDLTFNEIWNLDGTRVYLETPQDTFRIAYIDLDGKYLEFLKKTGESDKVIKQYYETLLEVGDFSPSLIIGILMNYEQYDIEDIRVKFIVAIHYLTLNDRFERKEKINKNSG